LASAGVAADESSTKAFGWKQAQQQTSPEGTSATKADSAEDDFPTEEECALGVRRMISGSIYGMREGLELLGLPSEPLFFVRGKRLLLLGRDIRSAVNAIIDEWMMENKEEFRSRLKLLQGEIWDIEARLRLDDDFHQGQAEAYEDHSNPSDSGSSAFDIDEVTGGKAKAEDVPSQETLLASAAKSRPVRDLTQSLCGPYQISTTTCTKSWGSARTRPSRRYEQGSARWC